MGVKTLLCVVVSLLFYATSSAQSHNTVQIDGKKYIVHDVERGETLYSLAKHYGVTIDEIVSSNRQLRKGLKSGQRIKIPVKGDLVQQEDAVAAVAEQGEAVDTLSATADSSQAVRLKMLERGARAKVALMLPLGSEVNPSRNYLDFYRGFMLGMDTLRRAGISVDVTLYNTAHNHSRIDDIISSRELEGMDLVVGPIYEDELIPVASSLKGCNVPIVSPLANLTMISDSRVFQMSPAPDTKFDKVRALFDGSKRVVIIHTDNVDKEFDAEVRSMLRDTSYVVEHKYIYEHPSIIERREKEREKMREEGLEVDDTPSPSDMSPLLRDERETVFVITANNEVEVDRILTAIASANISLSARSQTVSPFVVFGNNRWNRFANLDRAILFTNNVIMLSTYHARRSDAKIRDFDRCFVREFNLLPSLYAYRGYDAAVLFISSLYGAIENGMQDMEETPLLTPYSFKRDGRGVLVNDCWIRVNYKSDFTITTE